MRLSTFNVGNIVLYGFRLVGAHGISNARPDANQLGKVYITCEAVYFLELSICLELQHLCQITEVAHKVVEVVNTIFLHCVGWHQVAHERPYLGCCITDRCTSSEDNITSIVLLQYGLGLQIHALRLL